MDGSKEKRRRAMRYVIVVVGVEGDPLSSIVAATASRPTYRRPPPFSAPKRMRVAGTPWRTFTVAPYPFNFPSSPRC